MRFDRRRTRGVALILTAFVVVVAGAGGGLAVTDFAGPPATGQSLSLQSDNATTDDPSGESDGDVSTEAVTASDETSTATPDETGADEADAADESAASTATPEPTEASTSTPEPTDAAPSEESESTGGEAESTDGEAEPASEESGSAEEAGPSTTEDATPNGTDGAVANESAQDAPVDNATTATDGEANASSSGEIASCTAIDEPGEYELTGDVDGGSGTCIAVESSDVVLDGNGHTVAGSGSGTGIHVAGDASDVTVRNVDVSDWDVAVELGGTGAGGPQANLVDVRATGSDTGVRLTEADDSAMQAVTARDNDDGIVLVDTAGVQASDVTVAGNDGTGLWLTRGVSDSSFSIVQATGNGDRGIYVATGAVNNFVGDATVTDNGGPGVEFADSSNNVLADSRVERNDGPGVLSYPAGGDRLENVELGENGDGAYRDRAAVAGAVADAVQLRDGASVRFDQGVTHLGAADAPDTLPPGTDAVGPAVDVTLRDGASATVTVPVDTDGEVTAYQRVDGDWTEIDGVTVADGEAEIPVSGSGVVVPAAGASDDATASESGDDATATESGDGATATESDDGAGGADSDTIRADLSTDGAVAAAAATDQYALDDGQAVDSDAADSSATPAADGTNTLVIGPASADADVDYTLRIDGNVSKVTEGNVSADANDVITRTNGTSTVNGTAAEADAYVVDGALRQVHEDGSTPGYFLRYAGSIGGNETRP